ncbi:MAG: protein SCO1/2 [Saprospiraceae bacterium]|jgi:protein SCO1/2
MRKTLSMLNKLAFGCLLILIVLSACTKNRTPLPIIGDRTLPDGSIEKHEIRSWTFQNQLGETISKKSLDGQIYLVDFFFTSCPSICPFVTREMLRIYNHVATYEDVVLASFTIDPKRDSVSVLKTYSDNLDLDPDRWLFLTGDKDLVMDIANEDYFVAALVAPDAPGGFDHSGKIILVDKKGQIRGFCEGTDSDSVNGMMDMIDQLRSEYE